MGYQAMANLIYTNEEYAWCVDIFDRLAAGEETEFLMKPTDRCFIKGHD